jgi:putative FmdB family regulatory protein
MPMYTYRCRECKAQYEAFAHRMGQRTAACACGGLGDKQLFGSRPAIVHSDTFDGDVMHLDTIPTVDPKNPRNTVDSYSARNRLLQRHAEKTGQVLEHSGRGRISEAP